MSYETGGLDGPRWGEEGTGGEDEEDTELVVQDDADADEDAAVVVVAAVVAVDGSGWADDEDTDFEDATGLGGAAVQDGGGWLLDGATW